MCGPTARDGQGRSEADAVYLEPRVPVIAIGVCEREQDRISDSDSRNGNNGRSNGTDRDDHNDKVDTDRNNLDEDNCNLNLVGNQYECQQGESTHGFSRGL